MKLVASDSVTCLELLKKRNIASLGLIAGPSSSYESIYGCIHAGHGAADFVDPPNGTLIVDFEGTLESPVTITCNITNVGIQITTIWHIENFRGNTGLQALSDQAVQSFPELTIDGDLRPSGSSLRNRLTISVLSSQLDGVTLYCGTGIDPRQANYPIRVYRKFLVY